MNSILQFVVAGQYQTAWQHFQSLAAPEPLDERWAGYALAILGRGFEAKDVLLRARRRGCAEASIELSFTQQSLGEFGRAKEALRRLNLEGLSGLDRAFAERQAGSLALSDGDYRAALDAFERAWVSAHDDDDGAVALPGIAQALAFVYAHIGHDARADQYYGFALERGSAAMRGSLLLARAASRINLERWQEAAQDLLAARPLLEEDAYSQPSLTHHEALLCAARGQWREALEHFLAAVKLADAVGNSVMACSAELGAASACLELNDHQAARKHLDRASKRCETPDEQADLAMLEGELQVRAGRPAQAVASLKGAAKVFTALHSDRSAGRAYLFLASAHLAARQQAKANTALEQAAFIWQALGPGSMLSDLRSLPVVLEHLEQHPDHAARVLFDDWQASQVSANTPDGAEVVLRTFGQVVLEVNGERVRLKMRRGPEVLAYLLRQGKGVSVGQVSLDLFPDTPARQAQLYFHQVRYELEKKIPGLKIPFEAAARTYSVRVPERFRWDALELERLLDDGHAEAAVQAFALYQGVFLPEASSDWANEERSALAARVLRAGLHWCETWFNRHQFGRAIAVARQLLEFDPLDEHLSAHLLRATEALEGRDAAQMTAKRLQERVALELGALPGSDTARWSGLEKQ